MRIITIVLISIFCVNLVKSYPQNGFQSKNLDELMLYETENDSSLRDKRTIGLLRQLFPEISQRVNPKLQESNNKVELVEDNQQAVAESSNNEVRVQFADDSAISTNNDASSSNDDSDLAPLDDIEDENRDKRNLGFDDPQSNANGGNGGGGSGAGSGNFLFDIIRLVAGSGSGSSGANDPAAGAPTPGPATEAVPGPVTRLFVIANRGISNLVQDLILRLAATSERIVNFKARLITSII